MNIAYKFCLFGVIALTVWVGFSLPALVNAKGVEKDYDISLDTPRSVHEVLSAAKKAGVRPIELSSTFLLNEDIITDGYAIQSETQTDEQIEQGFRDGRAAVIQTRNENADQLNRLAEKDRVRTGLNLPTMKKVVSSDVNEVRIKSFRVHGEEASARTAAASIEGKLHERGSVNSTNTLSSKFLGGSLAYAATTWDALMRIWQGAVRGTITTGRVKDAEKWVPEFGYSQISQATGGTYVGKRYSYQLMWWNDMSAFTDGGGWWGSDAYEHDVSLYNYDGLTYLQNSTGATGMPAYVYLASNLPEAYLDTRLDDIGGEVAYTIGSGRAIFIKPNTADWYWTQFFTNVGNASTDKAKLQAQLVTEYDPACHYVWGTFCLFGDTSVPIKRLISFPTTGTNVPSGWLSWQY